MTEIGQPFLVKNRPQTFLSRFLTTKSVLPGEPKVERWPNCTIIQLSRPFMNTQEQIFRPGSVTTLINPRKSEKWPNLMKIVKIGLKKFEFSPTYIENRKFFFDINGRMS